MATLWTMPEQDIIKARDDLQHELDVHEDHTITLLDGWGAIKGSYEMLIDRYNDELKKRVQ